MSGGTWILEQHQDLGLDSARVRVHVWHILRTALAPQQVNELVDRSDVTRSEARPLVFKDPRIPKRSTAGPRAHTQPPPE